MARQTFGNSPEKMQKAVEKSHSKESNAKRQQTRQENIMVRTAILQEIKNNFLASARTGEATYYQKFIDKFMTQAMKEPDGKCGQMLASAMFSEQLLKELDSEADKAMARELDFLRYRILKQCFREQQNVILAPPNTRTYDIVCCGRRAGKTDGAARLICETAVTPNSPICYIHKKFSNAIKQMYDKVMEVAEEVGLSIEKSSRTDGSIQFANGSTVTFGGNDNSQEADKYRGFKYRLIVIDEAAFQRNMKYLVEDVLEPTMADFVDSRIVLLSSPPRTPKTYFEHIWNEKKADGVYTWRHNSWNMYSNPYIPDAEGTIQRICEKKGLRRDSPLIAREYLSEWVLDTEAQVFKDYKVHLDRTRKLEEIRPDCAVIGVDFGWSDYNGVVTLLYNKTTRQAMTFRERKWNKSTVETVVEQLREAYAEAVEMVARFNGDTESVTIVGDSSEKSVIYELSTTYKLPAFCAYKYNKPMAITALAEQMRIGNICIQSDGPIVDECEQTVYKRDEEDNILPEIDDDIFHPDILDALLYAYRQMAWDCGEDMGGISSEQEEQRGY